MGMNLNKEQKQKKSWKRKVADYLTLTVGAMIYAISISLFLDPNSLAPGGVTGISIILNRITGVETGTLMFAVNIPILLLGMWKFGWKFILSTLYCTFLGSLFTNLLTPLGAVTRDPLLAALAGGALMALSLGLIFKAGATSGGTDIIIKLLRIRIPHLKTGVLFLVTDATIVTASAVVLKDIDTALYAGLVVIVNSILFDVVLYGRDGAKMLFIVSDCPEAIVKRLLEDLDVGVTYLSGRGAYSEKEKDVVLCVMKKHLSPKAEEIIRQEDPKAFMIVADRKSVV